MSTSCLHQLPFKFDATRLADELTAADSQNWPKHHTEQNYSGEWSAMALKSPSGDPHDLKTAPAGTDYVATPLLDQLPYIRDTVLPKFECDMRRVRLMRLAAGSEILEHIDRFYPIRDEVRIHIPLLTNQDVTFTVDGQSGHLAAGETWYMDFNAPHAVSNKGSSDRVHLVLDCILNDWLRELLPKPFHIDSLAWAIAFRRTALKYAWRDARKLQENGHGAAIKIFARECAYEAARTAGLVKAR